MPHVNPEILRWARETAGLSPDEAARSLSLGGVRYSGEELLRRYEEGVSEPSRPLLLKMAKAYRRPLLAFYLSEPPRRGERGEDFRSLPGERLAESRGQLDALVRDVYVRQRLVRTTLEEADEATPHPFVGSIRQEQGVKEVCHLVSHGLSFDLTEFRRQRGVEDSFGYLRAKIEQAGIFVLLIGNLGSHHSNVSPEVFRGFALADDIAPFIVVNDQDAKSAWSFTALHELVHIWLGKTGISGGSVEQGVERFCNDVASHLLLPVSDLVDFTARDGAVDQLAQDIGEFARVRRVSSSMVAYRLYQASVITKETWQAVTQQFRELWLQEKAAARKRADQSSGPNYYVVRRHRVGGALLDVVRRNLAEGILTPTKAGKVLGVRPNNVNTMLGGT